MRDSEEGLGEESPMLPVQSCTIENENEANETNESNEAFHTPPNTPVETRTRPSLSNTLTIADSEVDTRNEHRNNMGHDEQNRCSSPDPEESFHDAVSDTKQETLQEQLPDSKTEEFMSKLSDQLEVITNSKEIKYVNTESGETSDLIRNTDKSKNAANLTYSTDTEAITSTFELQGNSHSKTKAAAESQLDTIIPQTECEEESGQGDENDSSTVLNNPSSEPLATDADTDTNTIKAHEPDDGSIANQQSLKLPRSQHDVERCNDNMETQEEVEKTSYSKELTNNADFNGGETVGETSNPWRNTESSDDLEDNDLSTVSYNTHLNHDTDTETKTGIFNPQEHSKSQPKEAAEEELEINVPQDKCDEDSVQGGDKDSTLNSKSAEHLAPDSDTDTNTRNKQKIQRDNGSIDNQQSLNLPGSPHDFEPCNGSTETQDEIGKTDKATTLKSSVPCTEDFEKTEGNVICSKEPELGDTNVTPKAGDDPADQQGQEVNSSH